MSKRNQQICGNPTNSIQTVPQIEAAEYLYITTRQIVTSRNPS